MRSPNISAALLAGLVTLLASNVGLAGGYCPNAAHRAPAAPPAGIVPDVLKTLGLGPDASQEGLYVRCAGAKLLACSVGANLNCFKADVRRKSPGATAWCREHRGDASIPMAATGHDTIYSWSCKGSRAVAGASALHVDAQGYVVENWTEVR